jgi:hypothetical protein
MYIIIKCGAAESGELRSKSGTTNTRQLYLHSFFHQIHCNSEFEAVKDTQGNKAKEVAR